MHVAAAVLGLLAVCAAVPAASQSFPARPVRFIVAFEASSAGDVAARLVASRLGENLGQQVLVENRGGAGGGIAAETVARAAPDGYTLLFTTPNPQVVRPLLAKSVSYDPVRDFTPVALLVETVIAFVAHPSLPSTVKELLQHARAHPGKLAYGTSGVGSTFHFSGELLKEVGGAEIVHVPYKGAAPAIADLIAGRIQLSFTALGTALPPSRAGKLNILAVLASKRFAALPEVPTLTEALPGFENPPFWLALFGPAAVPQPVVARLNSDTVRALNVPEVRDKLASMGMSVVGASPEETGARLKRDIALSARIIKAAGIQPE